MRHCLEVTCLQIVDLLPYTHPGKTTNFYCWMEWINVSQQMDFGIAPWIGEAVTRTWMWGES